MEQILDFLRQNPGGWSLLLVFAAAALEYMVPPLPGDSIVLAGSLLVVAGAWSFSTVALVVIAGGFLGSAMHYGLGRLLLDERGSLRGGRWIERLTGHGSLDRFMELFRKHGMWVLVLNRAFPGVRAVAFLAAGAARLPPARTLLAGLISNVAWSLGLLLLGLRLGQNWQQLEAAFAAYKTGALILAAILALIVLVFRWRARGRRA